MAHFVVAGPCRRLAVLVVQLRRTTSPRLELVSNWEVLKQEQSKSSTNQEERSNRRKTFPRFRDDLRKGRQLHNQRTVKALFACKGWKLLAKNVGPQLLAFVNELV